MSVTIKEIAERASVSIATVSLVLNNKPGVKETTRYKILNIAKELDYNLTQRNLLTNQNKQTIRFFQIAKHGHTVNRDHDIFISDYVHGIHESAVKNGYNLEISTFMNQEIEKVIVAIQSADIRGAVILGTELSEIDIEEIGSLPIPIIFIDSFFEHLDFNFVNMDNINSVFKIVSSLYDFGHREIGIIKTDVEVQNFRLREYGFNKAVKKLGLELNKKHILSVDSTFHGAYRDMLQLLQNGNDLPTAFFSSNDIIAYGCIKALEEKGIKIPEDISIIGFDNLPLSSVMNPPLTTMQVSKQKIGEIAMSLLRDCIDNKEDTPTMKVLIGGKLICRNSVRILK